MRVLIDDKHLRCEYRNAKICVFLRPLGKGLGRLMGKALLISKRSDVIGADSVLAAGIFSANETFELVPEVRFLEH